MESGEHPKPPGNEHQEAQQAGKTHHLEEKPPVSGIAAQDRSASEQLNRVFAENHLSRPHHELQELGKIPAETYLGEGQMGKEYESFFSQEQMDQLKEEGRRSLPEMKKQAAALFAEGLLGELAADRQAAAEAIQAPSPDSVTTRLNPDGTHAYRVKHFGGRGSSPENGHKFNINLPPKGEAATEDKQE